MSGTTNGPGPYAEADRRPRSTASAVDADVIVVGAGPAGSATATHLARHGLRVSLLEKSRFPREKVCGDGLTPRGTRQLIRLGVDTSEEAGWLHNKGLRIYGGERPFQLEWPDLADFPSYGLVRPRADFDDLLARHAVAAGASLYELSNVVEPIIDSRTDRAIGVRTKDGRRFTAPMVVAADGNSTRLSLAMGLNRREDRPMGVAVRTYYASPRHRDDWLESWLELWEGKPGKSALLPGYGWIFGMGDGTCNVGLGILNTSAAFGKTDYKDLLRRWLENTPEDWGFRSKNMITPVRGAALPMGFNRQPHYGRGLLLVGDAGGMINPFNGEGIAYAMESAEIAATAMAEAHQRGPWQPGCGAGAGGLSHEAEGGARRLLHLGSRLREADRPSAGDAGVHHVRAASPNLDAVHPEAARQPDRCQRRRRHG